MGILNLRKFIFSFISLLFILNTTFAAHKLYSYKNAQLVTLEKQVSLHKGFIHKIRRSMDKLEKKLSSANRNYLDMLMDKEKIEDGLKNIRDKIVIEESLAQTQLQRVKKIITSVIVRYLDDDSEINLMEKKILLQKLKQEKGGYEKIKDDIDILKKKNVNLTAQVQRIKISAENILSSIVKMEEDKKDAVNKYIVVANKKDKLRVALDRKRAKITRGKVGKKRRVLNVIGGKFTSPVDDYVGMSYKKKGVTYQFKKTMPVRCPKNGNVIYRGELASYGNVVILDHGDKVHSVVFGNFSPMIKKGQKLKLGDIMGYTKLLRNEVSSIYFEVRKNNKPQETIFWVNGKGAKKNEIAKI